MGSFHLEVAGQRACLGVRSPRLVAVQETGDETRAPGLQQPDNAAPEGFYRYGVAGRAVHVAAGDAAQGIAAPMLAGAFVVLHAGVPRAISRMRVATSAGVATLSNSMAP